jgi:hypothetical protein
VPPTFLYLASKITREIIWFLVFKLSPCCCNERLSSGYFLLKMEPTQCSETSDFNTQTPGKYPEDNLSLSGFC